MPQYEKNIKYCNIGKSSGGRHIFSSLQYRGYSSSSSSTHPPTRHPMGGWQVRTILIKQSLRKLFFRPKMYFKGPFLLRNQFFLCIFLYIVFKVLYELKTLYHKATFYGGYSSQLIKHSCSNLLTNYTYLNLVKRDAGNTILNT